MGEGEPCDHQPGSHRLPPSENISLSPFPPFSSAELDVEARERGREAEEPWSDPAVWDMIATGNARAVHHIESPAMTGLCKQCNVRDIDTLIAIVSVIRPGAANEGKKLAFTRRYQGLEPITYPHPSLEPVLRDTFGLVVYEEHILQICEAFAGLNPGRADVLRRALNKQKRAVIQEIRGEFFASAKARGHEQAKIEEVWGLVTGFAGYAFCKAHSTAYGVEAYQSAWLKKYFPAEFMAAVLTNGKGFYDPLVYVLETHRLGIGFLPPTVNEPGPEFQVVAGGKVREWENEEGRKGEKEKGRKGADASVASDKEFAQDDRAVLPQPHQFVLSHEPSPGLRPPSPAPAGEGQGPLPLGEGESSAVTGEARVSEMAGRCSADKDARRLFPPPSGRRIKGEGELCDNQPRSLHLPLSKNISLPPVSPAHSPTDPPAPRYIRVPLTRAKGLTERTIERLLAERARGRFVSLADFHRRVQPLPEEMEILIRAGGFDEFGQPRTRQFWEAQRLAKSETRNSKSEMENENLEFDFGDDARLASSFNLLPASFLREPTHRERLEAETELFGYTVSGHPLELFADIAWDTYCPVARLGEHVGQTVVTCGLVVEQRTHHQITGEPMKFLTLADWTGMVETELFAQTYKSYGLATVRYPALEVTATVEPFENGRGFSLRVLRAGKPRMKPPSTTTPQPS